MSVDGNELQAGDCEYKIFHLLSSGEIQLAEKFLVLWRAFYSFRLNPIKPQLTSDRHVLPVVNDIKLKGETDSLSGFINFRAVNFVPSSNSAVMSEGIALNQFAKGVTNSI